MFWGYGNLFDDPNAVITCTYVSLMQIFRDQYIQEWHDTVSTCDQQTLDYYCMFKTDFKYDFLDAFVNTKLRKQLSRFRVCSHSLEIETGIYNNNE